MEHCVKRFAIMSNAILVLTVLFIFVACGEDLASSPQSALTEAQTVTAATLPSAVVATDTTSPANTPATEPLAATQLLDVKPMAVEAAVANPLTVTDATVGDSTSNSVTTSEVISSSAAQAPASAEGSCSTQLYLDLSGYPAAANLPIVLGCAKSDASLDPVAINEFGKGPNYDRFMLWFGSEKQIYVLLPNQTWLAYTDTWAEGQPEIACNPTNGAKTSPPLPRRGFGKLWCNAADVQKELGTIEREERLCQHSVTQRFERGRLLACFEDATIRYFRLLDDGKWDMLMVQ